MWAPRSTWATTSKVVASRHGCSVATLRTPSGWPGAGVFLRTAIRARSAPVGRLDQVEHEALSTLMAAQAGVRVPEVVTAALGPDGDALIVTRQPEVEPLELASPEQVSDETLEDLWQQVVRLHAAGISHGRLNMSNVLVGDDGPMLVNLSAATLGAPQSALDMDLAELLVACTVLVGPERALRRAVEAGFGDAIGRVLPYLQRAALTPHVRDLARHHEVALRISASPPRRPRAWRSRRSSSRCAAYARGTFCSPRSFSSPPTC